ncbi:energy-coupling factor transporter ATPase [Massilioclostridium coli]|uniref:ABC transporter ATP-binding protein n=1 Tax=Clostridium facile TaxID=2763035 RepID=A0ABR7IR36_9CLOT|nr:energy-coupling factor transporter ATPase [Massilioclostridium coli]MBC5787609.1 energy-coupling factor transporter ATPase [Clostridium facile]PWM99316.1 MAG: energy-coupling factor transporter ATPase [Massilioclostridium sp.]
MNEMIQTKDLCFEYQGEEQNTQVLKQMNLSIRKGEFIAVLGHNGSGKSTLAKHFNSILIPTSGTVYVEGIDTSQEELVFDVRQRVGMVFQNPDNQIVATLVEEDVAFAPENLGVPPEEIRSRVDYSLKAVGMYEYRNRAPHQLSGGQKQRVAIAGIIAMQPDCIVLDEATAMLDPRGRREVLETIQKLNRELGTTIVHITHYMEEAVLANRVVVVDNGEILLDGTPNEVFRHVEQLKQVGLDVPQVTELMYELRKDGFDVPEDVLTEQQCVAILSKLLEG